MQQLLISFLFLLLGISSHLQLNMRLAVFAKSGCIPLEKDALIGVSLENLRLSPLSRPVKLTDLVSGNYQKTIRVAAKIT